MQASVDADKCQGHLRCAQYAPEVFEVDDYGHSSVRFEVIPLEYEEGTRRAAANCPERAITITENADR